MGSGWRATAGKTADRRGGQRPRPAARRAQQGLELVQSGRRVSSRRSRPLARAGRQPDRGRCPGGRRAEIAQAEVRFSASRPPPRPQRNATCRCRLRPRAARPALRRPCRAQRRKQVDLLVAPTSGVSTDRAAPRTGSRAARAQDLPGVHRLGESLERQRRRDHRLEEVAEQPARTSGDHDGVRLGQACSRAADWAFRRRPLVPAPRLRRSDRQRPPARGDADARLELDGFDIEATDRADRRPARPGPPARHRPHALADSRNRPARRRPYTWRQTRRSGRPRRRQHGDSRDNLPHVFGVEPADSAVEPTRSQNIAVSCRRSASAPAGVGEQMRCRWSRGWGLAQGGDCGKQLAAMPDRGHADASGRRPSAPAVLRHRHRCRETHARIVRPQPRNHAAMSMR